MILDKRSLSGSCYGTQSLMVFTYTQVGFGTLSFQASPVNVLLELYYVLTTKFMNYASIHFYHAQ